MPLKMMYLTNNTNVAQIAERNTVDIIFIDLEVRGKNNRQANMNTVKSSHSIRDIDKIRNVLTTAELLVRVNPLYEDSKKEIDEVIARGAEIVMLPMFYTTLDAANFIEMVNGRAKVILLAETKSAENSISKIASIPGVDGIHIGLNDLHIAHEKTFMFELLAEGNVEIMCKSIAKHKIPYGFGGIAKLNEGTLPARNIIAEHYRLGSSMVILSRTFCNAEVISDFDEIESCFESGMKEIRDFERLLPDMPDEFFSDNKREVEEKTKMIVGRIIENEMQKRVV